MDTIAQQNAEKNRREIKPFWPFLGVTVAEIVGPKQIRINAPKGTMFWVSDFLISIEGVELWNALANMSTGAPYNFVVAQTLECAGDGTDILNVAYPLITESQYRNCSALPEIGAKLYGGRQAGAIC